MSTIHRSFRFLFAALCAYALIGGAHISAQAPGLALESDPALITKYQEKITPEALRDHLFILASDEFEGRETGQLGQKLAAEYIARHFFHIGLSGPVKDHPNPYYQHVPLYTAGVSNFTFASPHHALTMGDDCQSIGRFEFNEPAIELVFAGYALELPNYNDLEGLNIRGKGVVFIDGVPEDKKGERMFSNVPRSPERIRSLFAKGARFVLATYPSEEEYNTRKSILRSVSPMTSLSLNPREVALMPNPIITVSPGAAARLFGLSPQAYQEALTKAAARKKPAGGAWTTTVSAFAKTVNREVSSENVLGYLEGTDLKDEVLVITAHYDHIGVTNGQVNNGADDDGSGTVAVLEIANAFAAAAEAGARPRRSILFMTVTGEEKGLFGSAYYADRQPVFPLENTIANLNIDMIGRIDEAHLEQPNYVYIIGSNMLSSELHAISEAVAARHAPDLKLDYTFNSKDDPQRFYYRSDHYNFAKNNIPVIFYFNGVHEDYHRPTDTPDKIDYEVLALRARLIFAAAWELANRERRPLVDKAGG